MELDPSVALETGQAFIPPSIDEGQILGGESYTYFTPRPSTEVLDSSTEFVLGIDEAGRGPVLGPMVYGIFYVPQFTERSLLADTHHFDDSKVLTPAVRLDLMQKLCTEGSDLQQTCGWGISALSPRAISSGMLQPGSINLNAQAFNATVELIQGVTERNVKVAHVYVDTIGQPAAHQRRLEQQFPTLRFTVAKKADSLYPCVSAASVCAKVTRDIALEASYRGITRARQDAAGSSEAVVEEPEWGSGYPSDARCVAWLKQNMDPVFGWGNECRFSWGTVKDMLDGAQAARMTWPEDERNNTSMSDFMVTGNAAAPAAPTKANTLATWYGNSVTPDML